MSTLTAPSAPVADATAAEAPVQLTREQLISIVVDEATAKGVACTTEQAEALIATLEKAAAYCRDNTGKVYFFEPDEMSTFHAVLDAVVPDNTVANPGSAHAELNRALLTGGQVAFTHTRTHRDDDQRFEYCSVHTGVVAV
jgi:hypothetical protein